MYDLAATPDVPDELTSGVQRLNRSTFVVQLGQDADVAPMRRTIYNKVTYFHRPTPFAACTVPTYWYAPLLYAGAEHLALRAFSFIAALPPQLRHVL
tara:strand:- start:3412 stop:3702 length:291 start_codon:yes stop_codon:yes gene_type:complete